MTNLKRKRNSLSIVRKHVFICRNPYIYTTVVQEVYNRDRSPDDAEGLAAAATKHLELLKQKEEAERSYMLYMGLDRMSSPLFCI
jgi:hypothetical protein